MFSDPEVVDLLISLFYKHAIGGMLTEGDGLLPTWQSIKGWLPCTGTLQSDHSSGCCIRGMGTFFKVQVLPGDVIRVVPVTPDGRCIAEQTRKVKSVESDDALTLSEPFSCTLEGVTFHRIRDSDAELWDIGYAVASILDGIPMQFWATSVPNHPTASQLQAVVSQPAPPAPFAALFGGMPSVSTMRSWVKAGGSLRSKLDESDGRLYPLLRWILCSMRGHLRFVDGATDGIPQLAHLKQFVMLCSKPETEATFQQLAATNETKYAFHGSPPGNWHSILRNGLNFAKTTVGLSSKYPRHNMMSRDASERWLLVDYSTAARTVTGSIWRQTRRHHWATPVWAAWQAGRLQVQTWLRQAARGARPLRAAKSATRRRAVLRDNQPLDGLISPSSLTTLAAWPCAKSYTDQTSLSARPRTGWWTSWTGSSRATSLCRRLEKERMQADQEEI